MSLTYTVNYPAAEVNDLDGGTHETFDDMADAIATIMSQNLDATSFIFVVTTP